MRITCVTGLPGSGKSEYVRAHMQVDDWWVDDPQHVSTLPAATMWSRMHVPTLWITDPYFCIPETRHNAHVKLYELYGCPPDWIFFENDADACMQNVARRQDGRKVRGLIHALKSRYQIPLGATVLPVWRPTE